MSDTAANKSGTSEIKISDVLSVFSEDALAKGETLLKQPCLFLKGAVSLSDLPLDGRVEIAFAGRSNVGKSSLLNALVRQKSLARTSNTPGRTRELNYFTLGSELYIVDMPGYGYAKASKSLVEGWTKLIHDYLKGRAQLRRVFVLIDSRHGVKESDQAILKLLDQSAVSYQAVLTKTDKLKASELDAVILKVAKALAKRPAAHPHILVTSSEKRIGFENLSAAIAEFLP